MTPNHLIPRCDQNIIPAKHLRNGDCVMTIHSKNTILEILATTKTGVYTAITKDTFIVVNDVIVSPYSIY